MMLLASERLALARAGRTLAAPGLVIGTSGNLSALAGKLVAASAAGGVIDDALASLDRMFAQIGAA